VSPRATIYEYSNKLAVEPHFVSAPTCGWARLRTSSLTALNRERQKQADGHQGSAAGILLLPCLTNSCFLPTRCARNLTTLVSYLYLPYEQPMALNNRAKVPATSKDATRPSKKPALPKSASRLNASNSSTQVSICVNLRISNHNQTFCDALNVLLAFSQIVLIICQ